MSNEPTNSKHTHACVERDLDSFATRTDRYLENRRINGVIRSAQQLNTQMTPGKTCLRGGPGKNKNVRFDDVACTSRSFDVDMQPAHWIDGFHEPESTHPSLIFSGENENLKTECAEQSMRTASRGPLPELSGRSHRAFVLKRVSAISTLARTHAQSYWLDT